MRTFLIVFNLFTVHIEHSWYGGPEITSECYLLLSFNRIHSRFCNVLAHQGWIAQYIDLQCLIVLYAKIFQACVKNLKKSRYYFALPVVQL